MPAIGKGEGRKTYVSRCIPVRRREHPGESASKSAAACHGMYDRYLKNKRKRERKKTVFGL